ncbi:MAG: putative transposase [Methanoculleus sp.]|nr:putative transposase [Methanoculleus sp.]
MVDTAAGAAVILDGKRMKSINRWYSKENARLQSIKDKQKIGGITRRQAWLLKKRDCRIDEAMNRYVNWIVDHVLRHKIGTVILPRDLAPMGQDQEQDRSRQARQPELRAGTLPQVPAEAEEQVRAVRDPV